MKKLIIFLFCALIANTYKIQSQDSKLDKYKYIIVSSKFDFVNKLDKYKTSSLTKFLFTKLGFPTYLNNEDEIPKELSVNRCKALYASVRDDSGVFKTKSYVELRDCKDNLVVSSQVGTSRLKDYGRAYYQSITEAFKSLAKLKYNYNENASTKEVVEIEDKSAVKKVVKKQPIQVSKKVEVKNNSSYKTLDAKPNKTGYALFIDSKIVFTILKTNQPNRFIIKDKNGTLTREGNYWLAEYYVEGEFVVEKYIVKF